MTQPITPGIPLEPTRPPAVHAEATVRSEADLIIRPAAIIPMTAARALLDWLAANALERGGLWSVGQATGIWQRFDKPWAPQQGGRAGSQLVGTIFVTYDKPRKHDVVVHRVQLTDHGLMLGWTSTILVNDVLDRVGLTLDKCPRDVSMSTHKPAGDPFRRSNAYARGEG